jgi:hypothetical protein
MATLGQQVAERKELANKRREIRDRKNYGQYGSGFANERRAEVDRYLSRLGGFRMERGPGVIFL